MKLYNSFSIKKNHKNSIILIGNFDGLHLGHQKLFRLAKRVSLFFILLVLDGCITTKFIKDFVIILR